MRLPPIRPPSPWGRNRTFAKYFQAATSERPECLSSATPSASAPATRAGWTSRDCNDCVPVVCCRWCLDRQGRLGRCDQRRSSQALDSAACSRWVRRTARRGASSPGCSHGVDLGWRCCARPRRHSRSSQCLHHQPPRHVMGCPQMSHSSTSLQGMRAPRCCDVMPTAWAWMGRHGVGCYPGTHWGCGSRQGVGCCAWVVIFDDQGAT